MNLDWLRSFAVFARHLNFTHTARVLHISQPALHVQIRKLSEYLGVPLYGKEGRRLVLTREGERAAAFAGELESRIEDFVAEMKTGAQPDSVVLAAGEGAFLYLLGEGIRIFSAEHGAPRMRPADREACIAAIRSGEAHLGVTALDAPPQDIEAQLLTEVPMMVVMPEHHQLAAKGVIRAEDLADMDLITPPEGRPHRAMIGRILGGVSWRPAVEASGWELMLRFVSFGMGLAIVNACCHLSAGLVARPFPGFPPVRYHLIHRKGQTPAGKRRELADILIRHIWRPDIP